MRAAVVAWLACCACGRYGFSTPALDGAAASDAAADATSVPVPADFTDGSRLHAYVETDDAGTSVLTDWYDTLLDEHCTFATAADGVLRCLPNLGSTRLYGDSVCTELVADVDTTPGLSCGLDEKYARSLSSPFHVYLLDAPFTAQTYLLNTNGACVATNDGDPLYAVGAEVPPSMFVAATETSGAHGRLSWIEWSADDGATQLTNMFFDNVLATRCTLNTLEPQTSYCVPDDVTAAASIVAYADAALTQQVAIYGELITTARAILDMPTTCSNGPHIVTLGPQTTATLYQPTLTGTIILTLPNYQFAYPVLAETDISVLDSFSISVDSGATPLVLTHWRDADGNCAPAGLWDTTRARRCQPFVDDITGALVCHLRNVGTPNSYFSESTCTDVAVLGLPVCRDTTGGTPYPSLMDPPDTCDGARLDLRAYDALVPAATTLFEATAAGTCEQLDLVATPVMGGASEFADASSLVVMHHEVD